MAAALLLGLLVCVSPAQEPALRDSAGLLFRLIPAGYFLMGLENRPGFAQDFNLCASYSTDYEMPQHGVQITRPFYLGETEVTVGQFRKFVAATGYQTTAEKSGKGIVGFQPKSPPDRAWFKASFEQKPEFTWRNPGFPQEDDHPVVGVSFRDALAFCEWRTKTEGVTYRLPTEAEWEYACRAGSDAWFPWGDNYRGTIQRRANIGNVELEKAWSDRVTRQWFVDVAKDSGDAFVYTAPAGSFPANAFGLHDMIGNAWEWCADHYTEVRYQTFKRPRYDRPTQRALDPVQTEPWNEFGDWRSIRGGCWYVSPVQARSAVRGFFEAGDAGAYLGFRVAREASAEALAAARRAFEESEAARAELLKVISEFFAGQGNHLKARFARPPERAIYPLLPRVVGLAEIELNANRDLTREQFELLGRIPLLRALHVHNAGNQSGADAFAPLAHATRLEKLELVGESGVSDAALPHFAGLTNLLRLRVDGPAVTDAGVRHLRQLRLLESLDLRQTKATGAALSNFVGAPLRSLQILDLDDESARYVGGFTNLYDLTVRGPGVTTSGFAHFAALTRLERLDVTDLSGVSDRGFSPLARMLRLNRLQAGGTGLGDEGVRHLVQLPRLAHLTLGGPALTDAGLRAVCELVGLQELVISADATNVTDRGFGFAWRLHRLNYLTLGAPRLTGAGFAPLAELNRLETMHVFSPALTDEGLRHLASVPNLKRLTLGDWGVGGPRAVTVDGLLALAKAPKLETISLFRKNMSLGDADTERLKAAFQGRNFQVR